MRSLATLALSLKHRLDVAKIADIGRCCQRRDRKQRCEETWHFGLSRLHNYTVQNPCRADRLAVCLDSRMLKKGYGKIFMRALPACRKVGSLDELGAFFSPGAGAEAPKKA